MKKYIIKDNLGNKKTIYADNLSHAIKLNDNKIQDIDASSLVTLFSKYGKPYGYACKTKPRMSSSASKYLGQLASYTLSPIGKYDTNKAIDFVDFLNRKGYEAAIFAPDIIVKVKQDRSSGLYHSGHERTSQYDSEVKDANRPMTFKFFINNRAVSEDEYTRSFIEEAAREHQSARTAKSVINEDKETAKSDGKSTFFFESGRKFSIVYDSKVRDEASLATSINALVTDEKAAIDSYNVAINNLKGKIDDNAMQVLINIRDDERRHIENLYAILNNQVTEKNLEDIED